MSGQVRTQTYLVPARRLTGVTGTETGRQCRVCERFLWFLTSGSLEWLACPNCDPGAFPWEVALLLLTSDTSLYLEAN